jgi:hypothetical protein
MKEFKYLRDILPMDLQMDWKFAIEIRPRVQDVFWIYGEKNSQGKS